MKWLLDTHVLDWATSGDPRLSGAVERFLASETAEVDRVITEMHEHSQLKHDELDEPGDGTRERRGG